MAKRKGIEELDERHVMRIMPLGAGNEVGRSCIILKFKGKTIMLDCGVHPGYSGHGSLPFFDGVEADEIDLLLITHFHIDHVAALPHFTEKTNFKGRVFMTHPTKAVMQMMLRDFLRVSNISVDDQIYDDKDLNNSIAKVEIIDFHQEKEHNGIKFTPYNAGHVLGACMYLIEIGGVKVLYTGDYSLEDDRHLMAAEVPSCTPDVLIVESTYGVQVHQSVIEREGRFTGQVESVVRRGGRCLLPVFALGRTQELLLILDEHWQSQPDLHDIPIYFASKLAAKALRIYQTYINMMNERIRKQIAISNPFQFQFISNLKSMEDFDDSGPCVVMASPGMLQSGVSRELFERWCVDKRNACIIPGYVVEGTLAKKILSEPTEITAMDGRILPMNCTVEYISFSAHADFVGTSGFIEKIQPSNIILVHGERNEMMRLKVALQKKCKERSYQPSIHTPANMEEILFEFKGEKMAKAIGTLANVPPKNKEIMTGYLVEHDFHTHLMTLSDFTTYTQLLPGKLSNRQHIPFYQRYEVLEIYLKQMFDDVECIRPEDLKQLLDTKENQQYLSSEKNLISGFIICQKVMLTYFPTNRLIMEWNSSPVSDMIADAIVAIAMEAQASSSSFKVSQHPKAACLHDHSSSNKEQNQEVKEPKLEVPEESNPEDSNPEVSNPEEPEAKKENKNEVERKQELAEKDLSEMNEMEILKALGEDLESMNLIILYRFFRHQYGDENVKLNMKTNAIMLSISKDEQAVINYLEQTIECTNEKLKNQLQSQFHHFLTIFNPLKEDPN